MKIKKFLVMLIIGSLIMGTASAVTQHGNAQIPVFENQITNSQGKEKYVPSEILVKFKPGVSDEKIRNINSRQGTSIIYTSPYAGFKRLHIPKSKSVSEMVEIYSKNPNVDYAEPNYIAYALMAPNDPLYSYQWHLDNSEYGGINMEDAWDLSDGTGVVVAVLDTGVAYENYDIYAQAPDLADTNFVPGYDFINNDAHPDDDHRHGTHVTGTIAQSTNNNRGTAGVAFNCSIMPVKVLNSEGSGSYDLIADGIYYAADNGAKVISMSLGGPTGSITLENALIYAYNKGVTIVCASGNDGSDTKISYPAAYDAYCIAVGATRYDEGVAYYSNGGSSLDLTAPGGQLNMDQNDDNYGDGVLQQTHDGRDYTAFGYYFYQGTSMATPHVSGVAALLISAGVASTPDEVREALQSTAEDKEDPGWDPKYGWGIVDAYAALQWTSIQDDPLGNNAPVALDDTVATSEDTPITVNVLANDSDVDMDPLTVTSVSDPSNGGAEITSGTTVTYTPDADYCGPDSYTYTVSDGNGSTDTATVTITVECINDPPVAVNDTASTSEGTPVTVDVIANDYDVDMDSLTVTTVSEPACGTATDNQDGTVTYTPGQDYSGFDSFMYTVCDSGGLCDTATVNIEQTIHIANIEMYRTTIKLTGWYTFATATVTIVDNNDKVIQEAAVYGHWSGAVSGSNDIVTDSDGSASFDSNPIRKTREEFIFTVDRVVKEGFTYNPNDNIEFTDSI